MSEPRTAGPFLAAKLHALDERLREVAPRVLSPIRSEDALHDLRVALRRTRTILEASRSIFGRFRCDEVRAALRDIQRATSALRDEEVLLDLMASPGMSDPKIQGWLKGRSARERRLRRELTRAIEAGELDRGRRLLDALLAFRVEPRRDRRLTKFARRAVADARRRVERRRGARIDDPRAMHRLRIAYKRLRYVVEAFAEALPTGVATLAQTAARLQNRLGRIHDVDTAMGCVGRARALSPEARRELIARLQRMREDLAASYLREAAPLAYTRSAAMEGTQESGVVALRKSSTR